MNPTPCPLTSASVLVLRRRHGDVPRSWRLPGGPLIPLGALALSLSLALLLSASPTHLVAVGIAILIGSAFVGLRGGRIEHPGECSSS